MNVVYKFWTGDSGAEPSIVQQWQAVGEQETDKVVVFLKFH